MGRSAGLAVSAEEFAWALVRYYELAGWDVATGTPTAAKLRELGLDWVAEQVAA
jgi:aldehyde:ferredoxin oxidoreductase